MRKNLFQVMYFVNIYVCAHSLFTIIFLFIEYAKYPKSIDFLSILFWTLILLANSLSLMINHDRLYMTNITFYFVVRNDLVKVESDVKDTLFKSKEFKQTFKIIRKAAKKEISKELNIDECEIIEISKKEFYRSRWNNE